MPNVAVKRRIRPILHAPNQPVLDRIDVAILDVTRVVRIVPDQMFPEPPLPNPTLTARDATGGKCSFSGKIFENWDLINLQRVEKSASLDG
jgi:hypothetical protein